MDPPYGAQGPGPDPEPPQSPEQQQRLARRERRRLVNSPTAEYDQQGVPSPRSRNARNGSGTPTRNRFGEANMPVSPGPPRQDDQNRFAPAELQPDVGQSADFSIPAGRFRRRMSATSDANSPNRMGSEHGSESDTYSKGGRLSGRPLFRHSSVESGGRFAGGLGMQGSRMPGAKTGRAEVNFIGEITGASGFEQRALFCRWQLVYDPTKSWQVVRGLDKGATHVCSTQSRDTDFVIWEHPIDLQLSTQSIQGWPSILIMVYARDDMALKDMFVSYALCDLPTTPGIHDMSCATWYAAEANNTLGRKFFGWFTGIHPRLEDESFITDLQKRDDAGAFVCTVGAGTVHLRMQVLMRDLQQLTHVGGESLYASLERIQTVNEKTLQRMQNKMAALMGRNEEEMSQGLRLVREGRSERFAAAQAAVDSRRYDQSPAGSEASYSRSRSVDPQRQSPGRPTEREGSRSSRSAPRLRSQRTQQSSEDGERDRDRTSRGSEGYASPYRRASGVRDEQPPGDPYDRPAASDSPGYRQRYGRDRAARAPRSGRDAVQAAAAGPGLEAYGLAAEVAPVRLPS